MPPGKMTGGGCSQPAIPLPAQAKSAAPLTSFAARNRMQLPNKPTVSLRGSLDLSLAAVAAFGRLHCHELLPFRWRSKPAFPSTLKSHLRNPGSAENKLPCGIRCFVRQ